ncbi:wall-associated receptor kinase-like 14 [Syzygium oleosum]|uniref:wall-associated receptor kinase-like 14 n=1 Tax=Syzygium oleosum TaxID=219896 RepID=UPI0024B9F16D|nr:wall-associated receptor kinase-like 14 [Syzygium oleosum]
MCPMIPKTTLSMLLLLASIVLPILTAAAHKAIHPPCSQTCSSGMPAKQNLTYPFGFSPGCPIQLNCTEDGDALIGEFLVQSASPDTITITIEANCSRPFGSIDQLYGRNYAPVGKNSVLLSNCTQTSPCDVPNTLVIQAQFQSLCESSTKINTSMNCYSEKPNHYNVTFLNHSKLFALGCEYFLSSISAEELNNVSVSLGVQMLQLFWWVNGDECECSQDADCVQLLGLPNGGGNGFRCKCRDRFLGDGFLAGTGCRRG